MTEAAAAPRRREDWERPAPWARWEVLALLAILVVGLALRLHGYAVAPALSDNQDELAWAWSGLTLITRGIPYSWSYLSAYHDVVVLHANGTTYPIVHPWLDHPPLFSAVVGAAAWIQGARDLVDVTVGMIRPVAIALSTVSIALIYVLGRRVLSREAAFVGATLLATAPVAVLFGRVVETENLLAPLLLGALILTHRLLTDEGGAPALTGLVLCCVAASLTKVPGLAVGVGCATVLVAAGRWRLALVAGGAALTGLLLYAAYGAAMDWQAFTAVIAAHDARRRGVMAAFEFIAAPAGNGISIRDGWWMLGWLGVGALLARPRLAARLIPLAVLIFAMEILLLADQRVVEKYGWYRVAVYPLVYAAAGYVCWEAVGRANLVAFLGVLALGGATAAASLSLGAAGSEWVPSSLPLGAALAVLILPGIIATTRQDSALAFKFAQATTGVTLLLILILNVVESLRLDQVYTQL